MATETQYTSLVSNSTNGVSPNGSRSTDYRGWNTTYKVNTDTATYSYVYVTPPDQLGTEYLNTFITDFANPSSSDTIVEVKIEAFAKYTGTGQTAGNLVIFFSDNDLTTSVCTGHDVTLSTTGTWVNATCNHFSWTYLTVDKLSAQIIGEGTTSSQYGTEISSIRATVTYGIPPSAPADPSITANAVGGVQVSSSNPSTGSPFTDVEQQISSSSTFASDVTTWTKGSTPTNPQTRDFTGLGDFITHYARARYRNSVAWGSYNSSPYNSDTTWRVPGIPYNIPSVTPVDRGTLRVTQSTPFPLPDDESPITNWNIYEAGDGYTAIVGTAADETTTIDVSGIGDDVTQTYKIRYINGVGLGALSINGTSGTTWYLPDAPTNLTFGGSGSTTTTSIYLSWTAPADTGGAPITSYEYRWKEDGGTYSSAISVGNITYYTKSTDLVAGTKYWFQVRAVTTVGEGAYLTEEFHWTLCDTPSAPTLSANAVESLRVQHAAITGTKTWQVWRSDTFDGVYGVVRQYDVGDVILDWTDTNLGNGSTRFYKLRVFNQGDLESEYSPYASSTTWDVPGTATPTLSTPDISQILITKNVVDPSSDRTITDWTVYRSSTSGGTYIDISGTIAIGTNTYLDTDPAGGETWYYKTTYTSEIGEGALSSYASITATIATGVDVGDLTSLAVIKTTYAKLSESDTAIYRSAYDTIDTLSDTAIYRSAYDTIDIISDSAIYRSAYNTLESESDTAVYRAAYGNIDTPSDTAIFRSAFNTLDKTSDTNITDTFIKEDIISDTNITDTFTTDVTSDTNVTDTFTDDLTTDSAVYQAAYNTFEPESDSAIYGAAYGNIDINSNSTVYRVGEIQPNSDTNILNSLKTITTSSTAIFRESFDTITVDGDSRVLVTNDDLLLNSDGRILNDTTIDILSDVAIFRSAFGIWDVLSDTRIVTEGTIILHVDTDSRILFSDNEVTVLSNSFIVIGQETITLSDTAIFRDAFDIKELDSLTDIKQLDNEVTIDSDSRVRSSTELTLGSDTRAKWEGGWYRPNMGWRLDSLSNITKAIDITKNSDTEITISDTLLTSSDSLVVYQFYNDILSDCAIQRVHEETTESITRVKNTSDTTLNSIANIKILANEVATGTDSRISRDYEIVMESDSRVNRDGFGQLDTTSSASVKDIYSMTTGSNTAVYSTGKLELTVWSHCRIQDFGFMYTRITDSRIKVTQTILTSSDTAIRRDRGNMEVYFTKGINV